MNALQIFLLLLALVLFILAAIPLPARVNLGWLGAAAATLALLVPLIH